MARIQRLDGQFKFGELDDCSMWYDDARNALIIKDSQGATLVEFGDNLTDVQNAIRGYQFQQMRTVDLFSAGELPQGTVVDASGAADDAVVAGAAASTATLSIQRVAETELPVISIFNTPTPFNVLNKSKANTIAAPSSTNSSPLKSTCRAAENDRTLRWFRPSRTRAFSAPANW